MLPDTSPIDRSRVNRAHNGRSRIKVTRAIQWAMLCAAMVALSPIASAYYYFVYFAGRTGPFTPVPARYDLTALSNNTISYLIQSSGPAVLVPGDTFNALISQIRLAAETWNKVSSCAIKLSFGGLSPMTQPDSSPEVDVVFDDNMPPGLLAQTRVTTVQDIADPIAQGATFIPVLNARVQLHNDLNANQQPSYSDAFFLTIVHEFGHSLGLQHTLTSSVMSTQITSSVTKSAPLAADDIAGISLHHRDGFAGRRGRESGECRGAIDFGSRGEFAHQPRWIVSNRRRSAGPVLRLRSSAAAAGDGRSLSGQYRSAAGYRRESVPGHHHVRIAILRRHHGLDPDQPDFGGRRPVDRRNQLPGTAASFGTGHIRRQHVWLSRTRRADPGGAAAAPIGHRDQFRFRREWSSGK
jgi:hypothetical protein